MAILSFAHLKNKPASPTPVQVASVEELPRPAPATPAKGIMSFAHLKRSTAKPNPASTVKETPQPTPNTVSLRVMVGVAKTALLVATNYCRDCPRFWPSDEEEKEIGVPYGRCCRSGLKSKHIGQGTEQETWKSIPATARVARCWYHINEPWVDLSEKELDRLFGTTNH